MSTEVCFKGRNNISDGYGLGEVDANMRNRLCPGKRHTRRRHIDQQRLHSRGAILQRCRLLMLISIHQSGGHYENEVVNWLALRIVRFCLTA